MADLICTPHAQDMHPKLISDLTHHGAYLGSGQCVGRRPALSETAEGELIRPPDSKPVVIFQKHKKHVCVDGQVRYCRSISGQ